ncbi:tetratricopeptide repeat protein [Chitinophaga nivalis]|uniref:Tetratricopeptide repeat protein n=1 Tax=Chitinophaga nivalis TaxID=2991709 RepID=A0ABT3IWU3_9BACT|nr:tetratricopeptide repeat protein [Chitinophaga nivalis]MCW3461862.1 tetratricopeptide repeat protein [Chitinophaga nivalis]MCW3488447.1 tetratricopeptide repeat protein [Chitinophaga nivalis]
MNLDESERLYNEQAYTEAAAKLELYLEETPASPQAWHLLGLCRLEIAKAADTREEAMVTYEGAYTAFSNTLSFDSAHVQARVHRAYMGANIMEDKLEVTLSDCAVLLEDGNEEIMTKALLYRFQVYVLQHETEKALADMHRSLEIYTSLYDDDLPQLNVARFQCHTRIGDVYYHIEDKPAALAHYKQAFQYTVYNNRTLSTAYFALDMADYDFAANLLHVLISSGENEDEDILRLLKKVKELLDEGVQHAALAREFCWGTTDFWQQFYGEDEDEGTLEQISTGKRFMTQYPEEAYFCHYTATAFFNIGSYREALPYYEKALAIRAYPSSIARWYYASYKVNEQFPASWPDATYDIPYDWYSAGVIYSEILQLEKDPHAKEVSLQLKKFLYKKAFDLYTAYWHSNTGNSWAGHPHHFAMCCNNYGITLYELGEFEEATRIHTIGYAMSPFWEQLESRADAWHSLGKAAEAITDRKAILEDFYSYLPLMYYVSIHERIIEDLTLLDRHEEALELYNKILEEYDTWISTDMQELETYDQETIIYNIDRIKTGRAFIKTGSANDLSERIRALEKHLEEKPDDSDAYFNLMYLYFDNAQYEHCIGAVNNRISIGGIKKLPVVSQMKIYYFRGKAALKLGRYAAAIADMQQTLQIMSEGDESDNSANNRLGVYAFLAEACLGEKDYQQCIHFGTQCVDMYTEMNWSWDAEASIFRYNMALAYESMGNIPACKKMIDEIVKNDPGYQPALQKKNDLKGGGIFSFFRKKK